MTPAVELSLAAASAWNRRYRVRLADGAAVEAVLYRGDTLCVSSQVGCAVACPFCASGARGFGRNLSLAELEGQLLAVEAEGAVVRRVTVSGVGEPLHNLRAVSAFVERCRARRTPASVTTSGGPLGRLEELLRAPHNGVTVSVHAGTEATRARLVPRGPALGPLFDELARVASGLSRSRRRKLALAYLLLEGENDGEAELQAFAERAKALGAPVHLFAWNPVSSSAARPVARARYEAIYAELRAAGLTVRMSSRARTEANGGCGTLVAFRASSPNEARGAPGVRAPLSS